MCKTINTVIYCFIMSVLPKGRSCFPKGGRALESRVAREHIGRRRNRRLLRNGIKESAHGFVQRHHRKHRNPTGNGHNCGIAHHLLQRLELFWKCVRISRSAYAVRTLRIQLFLDIFHINCLYNNVENRSDQHNRHDGFHYKSTIGIFSRPFTQTHQNPIEWGCQQTPLRLNPPRLNPEPHRRPP
jgi:hypothetical protein